MPGVGTFDFAVEQLHKLDLFKTIRLTVLEKKIPLLGICLGAQLMTKTSHEGKKNGLNLVDYETVAFNRLKMSITDKIPHMGWEYLQIKNNTKLFNNFDQSPDSTFYTHTISFVLEKIKQLQLLTMDTNFQSHLNMKIYMEFNFTLKRVVILALN